MGADRQAGEDATAGDAATIPMMEKHIGRRFKAVMLWEVGGNNGFRPSWPAPSSACRWSTATPWGGLSAGRHDDLRYSDSAAPWTMVDIRNNSVIFSHRSGRLT